MFASARFTTGSRYLLIAVLVVVEMFRRRITSDTRHQARKSCRTFKLLHLNLNDGMSYDLIVSDFIVV